MKRKQESDGPRYVAVAGIEEIVEASDNLDQLLAVLAEIVSPDAEEDVVVWLDGWRVVAVVLADGTIHRFDRTKQPADVPPEMKVGR